MGRRNGPLAVARGAGAASSRRQGARHSSRERCPEGHRVKVPSYDDLTPSIPDVEPADVFGSVNRLMPAPAPVGIGRERIARTPFCSSTVDLYAALHGPSADALVAIAREFSPRLQRYGSTDVVLDV